MLAMLQATRVFLGRMELPDRQGIARNHRVGAFRTRKSRQAFPGDALERFPIRWNHPIEKEALGFKELEHGLIEKAGQLFRNML